MKKTVFALAIVLAVVFTVMVVGPALATGDDKVVWCHTEPNGNQQTLELPLQALINAGHVDAGGNPLHAGDHPGACEVTPTPTVTPVPPADLCSNLENVQETMPAGYEDPDQDGICTLIPPTATPVPPTPTTPPDQPTNTPVPPQESTPVPPPVTGGSGGPGSPILPIAGSLAVLTILGLALKSRKAIGLTK